MEFPVYARNGVTVAEGRGYLVWDEAGKEYLDFYGGHAVAALGYRHPRLTAAIQEQVKRLIFQTNAVDLTVRTRACDDLVSIAPPGLECVFLVNSGAEANENALRLAFRQTGRAKVVALKGGFHGRTAAAGAVTDGADRWYGFPRRPFEVEWVEPEDSLALDRALGDDTAAFLFEPVQGVAGAVDLSPEFVAASRRLCTERGVVMIADEVQTGIGRTGHVFAVRGLGVTPDLLTTAKALAGGFPVGAVLAPRSIAGDLPVGSLGTTFGGGPVACAAVSATLTEIRTPGFLENVRAMSGRLREVSLAAGVSRVSGAGLLLGLHTDRPAKEVRAGLLERGVLTGDAKNPNVVRLLPPLIIDKEAVDRFASALREVLA